MTLLRPRLDPRLGPRDLGQPRLTPRQFLGYRHPVGRIRLIRSLGPGHQIGDLRLQLGLDLARVLIGQGAVTAGIGVGLRPVERNRPQLQDAHLSRHDQNRDEQPLDLVQKPAPERGDRIVIGVLIRRDEPERYAVVGRPLQLTARKNTRGIAINQKPQQKPGMVRRRARPAIAPTHRPQVKAIDDLDDKPRQMALRKPLIHRRRQKKTRRPVNRAEVAHQGKPQKRITPRF
jgi:hypothetical protein